MRDYLLIPEIANAGSNVKRNKAAEEHASRNQLVERRQLTEAHRNKIVKSACHVSNRRARKAYGGYFNFLTRFFQIIGLHKTQTHNSKKNCRIQRRRNIRRKSIERNLNRRFYRSEICIETQPDNILFCEHVNVRSNLNNANSYYRQDTMDEGKSSLEESWMLVSQEGIFLSSLNTQNLSDSECEHNEDENSTFELSSLKPPVVTYPNLTLSPHLSILSFFTDVQITESAHGQVFITEKNNDTKPVINENLTKPSSQSRKLSAPVISSKYNESTTSIEGLIKKEDRSKAKIKSQRNQLNLELNLNPLERSQSDPNIKSPRRKIKWLSPLKMVKNKRDKIKGGKSNTKDNCKDITSQSSTPSPAKKKVFSPFKWRGRKSDIRLQQLDGGFFERFGALFREYDTTPDVSAMGDVPLAPMPEETNSSDTNELEPNASAIPRTASEGGDSGVDSLHDLDSDPEEPDKSDFISDAFGWNIDELYTEILIEILHNVGCDGGSGPSRESLLAYIQDAFHMSNDRHNELLEGAEKREAPEIMLNVEVVEARDIVPKDPNGLADPFVTLYLQSMTQRRYNTSVKSETLSPVWEEHFSLPISENVNEDTLCLEVWDFDPAETVKEKLGKLFDVRGIRGLRKLLKEIAVTASTGNHENELIGKASIPLKTIPASGMTMWYSLDKKNKLRRQGVLRLHLTFSSTKQTRVAAQEHRHLMKILLMHEIENSKVCAFWWCGNYSQEAEALLTQHAAQSGLSQIDIALTQWSVYCTVHADHHLSFSLFNALLDKLSKPLQNNTIPEDEVKIFWDSVKRLLPSCFNIVRKVRKKSSTDKNTIKQTIEVLKVLSKLSKLTPPEKVDLFPVNTYPWLTRSDDGPFQDIRSALGDAVTQGASDWFNHVMENNKCQDNSNEAKMRHMIKIVQLVRSDLQKAVEFFDKVFQEVVNFQYARMLYILYEQRIATLVESDILAICKSLKRLNFEKTSPANDAAVESPLEQGTTLFELYLVLQRFVVLGIGLCPTDSENFRVKDFHQWFHGGVSQWLDIAVYKAFQRIEKAVELDSLIPVSPEVKYSSSAVDTLTIFYQIKVFWKQLNWPDVEGCYTFVAKIIDDICRCCVFFADKMSERVEGMGEIKDVYEQKFEVTQEWCLAINNIDYVRQSLEPFVIELGMEDILQRLEARSLPEAERCRRTLENVVENAVDTVRMKIIDLLEIVIYKMTPAMKRLLIEGAELHQQDSNSIDRVMRYLDNNLAMMNEQLNEDNFSRTLEVMWDSLANILNDIITTNIEKRRPPIFFANLRETLKEMILSFKQSEETTTDCEVLKKIERLLEIHGCETAELIHQFHLDRWEEQQNLNENKATLGLLTVRCQFQDCTLKIEVMNGRNLIPMDTNGLCDPFVKIHFLPEDKFTSIVKPKTQTQNRTLFPLYDQIFTINLSSEQRSMKNALIMFSVKDKDFLGMSNQDVGEAFIRFNDIPDTPESIQTLPQIHLILTRPTKQDTIVVRALEQRQGGDKQAKDFLKRLTQKMGPIVPQ